MVYKYTIHILFITRIEIVEVFRDYIKQSKLCVRTYVKLIICLMDLIRELIHLKRYPIFFLLLELLMRAEINRIRPSRERKPDSILTPTPKKIPDLDPTLRKIRVWDLTLRKNRIENQPFQQLDPDPTKIPQSWSAIGSAFFSQRKNYFVRTHLLIRKPW